MKCKEVKNKLECCEMPNLGYTIKDGYILKYGNKHALITESYKRADSKEEHITAELLHDNGSIFGEVYFTVINNKVI